MRSYCPYLIALALATLVAGCFDDAPITPPNVVVILIDDLGWIDTGVYGSMFYETPHIDRLAAEGMRFTQFYTASPVDVWRFVEHAAVDAGVLLMT